MGFKLRINFKNYLFSHFTTFSTNTDWVPGIGLDNRLIMEIVMLLPKKSEKGRPGNSNTWSSILEVFWLLLDMSTYFYAYMT